MKGKVTATLDRPNATFTQGDIVSGAVHVATSSEMVLSGIDIKLGYAVRAVAPLGTSSVSATKIEVKSKYQLFPVSEELKECTLDQGVHDFPFQILIKGDSEDEWPETVTFKRSTTGIYWYLEFLVHATMAGNAEELLLGTRAQFRYMPAPKNLAVLERTALQSSLKLRVPGNEKKGLLDMIRKTPVSIDAVVTFPANGLAQSPAFTFLGLSLTCSVPNLITVGLLKVSLEESATAILDKGNCTYTCLSDNHPVYFEEINALLPESMDLGHSLQEVTISENLQGSIDESNLSHEFLLKIEIELTPVFAPENTKTLLIKGPVPILPRVRHELPPYAEVHARQQELSDSVREPLNVDLRDEAKLINSGWN